MKKLLRATVIKLFGFFKGAICGALISVAPVALIHHKHLDTFLHSLNWPLFIFFSLPIIAGGIVCTLLPSFPTKKGLLALIYLFFYVSATILCQKINLTPLLCDLYQDETNNISISASPLTMVPGLLLICLATLDFVIAAIKQPKNIAKNKNIKHCYYLSWLLFMTGVPLLLGVWLPLIALPGAWIATTWHD